MTIATNETMTCFPVARAEEPADFAEGRIELGSLEVGSEIGRGGMAVIHAGREKAPPGRDLAIKFIHGHLATDPDLVRRFQHEVRAQLGLRHPCVVEMVGWGRDDRDRLFMAMELVDGPTLKDVLLRGHRMPVDLAVHVVRCMLAGLSAAHCKGLVHRDVKPANVMLTSAGAVKVADFGIAKTVDMTQLTSTGNVIGTPAYMSPEQALAKQVDPRSDLFSVGVVLHELLTGTNPFQTGNPATTLSRVVHHQQRPVFESRPQVPQALETLVDTLLQKDPAHRPAAAAAVVATLDACANDEFLAADDGTLAAWCADPEGVSRRLDGARAERHFQRGRHAFAGGKGNAEVALWELFLATLLDPAHQGARAWLDQVSKQRGYSLQPRATARIQELEAKLAETPDDLPLVMQLAKLHKAQGNFLQVIFYYKRARALNPPDRYTQNQLQTLVGVHAAPVIDGTIQVEACDFTLHSARPQRDPGPAARERAAGVVDFASGVLSTGWGKLAAGVVALAILTWGGGQLYDRASQAAIPEEAAAEPAGPVENVALPAGAAASVARLERAQEHAAKGDQAQAERLLVQVLADEGRSPLGSAAAFLLGECLERQGRRPEALAVHLENATENAGEWAVKSRLHRGELLVVDGRLAEAQAEFEAAAASQGATLDLAVQAQLALARTLEGLGRRDLARRELEDVQAAAAGTLLRDEARLLLAEARERAGEAPGALDLFTAVRESVDHKSPEFKRASAGVKRVQGTAGSEADSATWAEEPPSAAFTDDPPGTEAAVAWSDAAAAGLAPDADDSDGELSSSE